MSNPTILIWEGCNPAVVEAIRMLQDCWRPSSIGISGNTLRLIEELVDPAIAECAKTLPHQYLNFIPGVKENWSFSNTLRKVGLKKMAILQCHLLSQYRFMQTTDSQEAENFNATLETLIGLINACVRKENRKNPKIKLQEKVNVKNTPLNNHRRKGFCRFCSLPSQFTVFAKPDGELDEEGNKVEKPDLYPLPASPEDKQKTLRFSSQYCEDHRPKTSYDEWNPKYQKAKRSEANFNLELNRLHLQSVNLGKVVAQSGDPHVDIYIYCYVRIHGFWPGNEKELRYHARLMVDAKLSDRKKAIVLLRTYGISQSEIARRLCIPRQHVSRDWASIPDAYRQLPMLYGTPTDFLISQK